MFDVLTTLNRALNDSAIIAHLADKKSYFGSILTANAPLLRYELIKQKPAFFEESEAKEETCEVQIDIFTNTSFLELVREVTRALKREGFRRTEVACVEDEQYRYHVALYFEIETETEC